MPVQHQVDLLVVGGGINGVGVARDAAGRGLRVCLVEQSDLAGFTSSASTKLIHGGLRYLEYREFRLVREALTERERLLAIAPHLIRPLRFILPYTPGLRPRWQIRLGLFAYDHVGGRKHLPASAQIHFADDPSGVPLNADITHGFSYADCSVDDSRLVVLNAVDAAARGALVYTRLRLLTAISSNGGVRAECADLNGGRHVQVTARAVVNAAGAWINEVRASLGLTVPEPLRLIQGSHIVVRRLFDGDQAYILQNPDRRVVFVLPYEQDYTLIGTTDVPFTGDPQQAHITADEIQYLCGSVNRYFRHTVRPEAIVWSYAGIRSLKDDRSSEATAVTRDYDLKLETLVGGTPVLSVIGGKITTYRRLAEAVLAHLLPLLGCSTGRWTATAALPGGDLPGGDFPRFLESAQARWPFLSPSLAYRLARAYGTRMELILGTADSIGALGETFGPDLTSAEVNYLCEHEWAMTATDILWRRTKLGLRTSAAQIARLTRFLQQTKQGTYQGGTHEQVRGGNRPRNHQHALHRL
jgi:glycerol-3-phosphate dehydrogenase